MSLGSRGSRTVRIGDESYLWKIRPRPTRAQEVCATPMTLAVQRIEPFSRAVLIVDLGVSRPDNAVSRHGTMVTVAVVRQVVAWALADGWRPESGRGHRLEVRLFRDSPGVVFR